MIICYFDILINGHLQRLDISTKIDGEDTYQLLKSIGYQITNYHKLIV